MRGSGGGQGKAERTLCAHKIMARGDGRQERALKGASS